MAHNFTIPSFVLAPFSLESLINPLAGSRLLLSFMDEVVVKQVPGEGVRELSQSSELLVIYSPDKGMGVRLGYTHNPGDISE